MARLLQLILAAAIAVGAVAVADPPPTAAATSIVTRQAGPDRYATAAAVSAATFAPGVAVAFIATGQNFPDALAAGPPAAILGAPILLVRHTIVPGPTANELTRLRPGRIVVIGSSGVVSDGVLSALRRYATTGRVDRIFGPNRYATAAAVSAAHFSPGVPIAYVATGRNFPDALAGGVAGGRQGGPLLLTEGGALSEATRLELRRLRPASVVVLGSAGVVSDAVLNTIRSQVTANVRRIGGADRYETAALVSRSVFGGTAPSLRIATGRTFPDAITATPAAVRAGGPILLVPGGSVPPATRAEAVRLAPRSVVIIGSVGVVNERVNMDLRIALGNLAPLPACTYTDVPVIHGGYGDWHRTVLDTVYALPQSYHPTDLVNTSTVGANGGYLVRNVMSADMGQLFAAARAAGRPLQLVSGFRDWQTQQATFNYWVSVGGYEQALRTSARPGHSEHQLGTTFDVTTAGGADPWTYADWAATPTGGWMRDNAWRYGFVMSYPKGAFASTCYSYEPWHYRYVGREAAAAIRSSGLTPREWLWLTYH